MNQDQLVMEYLALLRVSVSGLPRADELVAAVGARIARHRIAHPDETPAQVQAYLDRVGNPYEIAAVAFRPRTGPPPGAAPARPAQLWPAQLGPAEIRPAPGGRPPAATGRAHVPADHSAVLETLAVVALTAGAVVAPVVGPLVGALLATGSARWQARDKVLAWTLVLSPVAFLLLCLPMLILGGADVAQFLVLTAAVGGVVGPAVAGGVLGARLSSRPAPVRPPQGRIYPVRMHPGPPYPPRFEPPFVQRPAPQRVPSAPRPPRIQGTARPGRVHPPRFQPPYPARHPGRTPHRPGW